MYDENGGDNDKDYYINDLNDFSGLSKGNNIITILDESLEWFNIDDNILFPQNLRLNETSNLDNLENRLKEYLDEEIED